MQLVTFNEQQYVRSDRHLAKNRQTKNIGKLLSDSTDSNMSGVIVNWYKKQTNKKDGKLRAEFNVHRYVRSTRYMAEKKKTVKPYSLKSVVSSPLARSRGLASYVCASDCLWNLKTAMA